jgi:hypothetical protein
MSSKGCRYAIKPYKSHFACFHCRKAFKEHEGVLTKTEHRKVYGADWKAICPECGSEMADMGLDFKAPRQNAWKQWKAIEELYQHGITFHSSGWCGPGYRPTTLREAKDFSQQHRKRSEGERLLQQIGRRCKG